jgi:hypothetical protein
MRFLKHCESHVTDSYSEAWLAIAEASAFAKKVEEAFNVTVVSLDICMDCDALYYCHVVVEVV